MSSRTLNSDLDRRGRIERSEALLIAFALAVLGIVCFFMPAFTLRTLLSVSTVFLILYGLFHIVRWFTSGRTRPSDLIYGPLALVFAAVLIFNSYLPEWLIRVCFGLYCLAVFAALAIQQVIHRFNDVPISISAVFFLCVYGILFVTLLFTDAVDTNTLIRLFGVYFLALAIRNCIDAFDLRSKKYRWKRGLHVSLPIVLATILPDFALKSIDAKIREGEEADLNSIKKKENVRLKAMVHIGPEGFQKVGHFTFSWDGTVFSYGNYDSSSGRFFGLIGDGVFFTVPKELYLPNIVKYEHNTIFEYSIATTPEQEARIEEQIEQLQHRSYRWYSRLEKAGSKTLKGYESDYPSRLHYRTGAKFYKIKKGTYKTYWAGGDNCVLFSDEILGTIGADVLSLRGIITPGAYYDYLESEYLKENSPVVEKNVYSWALSQPGI